MNWPKEGPLQLPALSMKITDVAVKTSGTLKVNRTEEMIELDVPEDNRDPIATVIELTVDGKAFEIQPVNVTLDK